MNVASIILILSLVTLSIAAPSAPRNMQAAFIKSATLSRKILRDVQALITQYVSTGLLL